MPLPEDVETESEHPGDDLDGGRVAAHLVDVRCKELITAGQAEEGFRETLRGGVGGEGDPFDDERDDMVGASGIDEGLRLLAYPRTLRAAGGADDNQPLGGAKRSVNLLGKQAGGEVGHVPECGADVPGEVPASAEAGGKAVVLQLVLQPFRPSLILSLVAYECIVFFSLFHVSRSICVVIQL